MKNLGKTAIICAIIFFVFVIAGGICFGIGVANTAIGGDVINNVVDYINGTNDALYIDSDSSPLSISQEFTLSDNITEIELDNICGDIKITTVSGTDVITAEYNGPASLLSNSEINFKADGDTLKINFGKDFTSSVNFGGINVKNQLGRFNLCIPESYMGSLELHNAAGDIEISGFDLKSLEIEDAAGEIDINDFSVLELSLNNTVGEVTILGEIGAIEMSDNLGETNIENTVPFKADCEIENTLGEVNIILPSSARINVEKSNILGEVSIDSSIVSANGINFEISSCLGEITITSK